jgi:DNA-binding protein H-NS
MFGKQKDQQATKTLSFDELIDTKRKLDLEIAGRQETELETLRAKVTAFADALGISVAEMFGIRAEQPQERRGKKRRDAVKYRDPDNPDNTWSGRGRLPKWLQEKIDQGGTKDQFQVQ